MRIRCRLLGCNPDRHAECYRCVTYVYDADFIQRGLIVPVINLFWYLRGWRPYRRCAHCHRSMWFRLQGPCCSAECYDRWIPF